MPPCHVQPFIQASVVIEPGSTAQVTPRVDSSIESCDYCGSPKLEWRKCKLICANCRQINKSCADL